MIASKILVIVMMIGTLFGCATHPNGHGGRSTGFAVDVDTPIGGVDASLGIHDPQQGYNSGHGGYGQGGYPVRQQTPPGQRALAIMQSTSALTEGWAGGEGHSYRQANCNANESGQFAGYGCSASSGGSSARLNGQTVTGGGHGGYQQNGESYRQDGGNFQRQSYGGGNGPQPYQGARSVQTGYPQAGNQMREPSPHINVRRRLGGLGGQAPYDLSYR